MSKYLPFSNIWMPLSCVRVQIEIEALFQLNPALVTSISLTEVIVILASISIPLKQV
jgi:hypothetical protein